MTNLNARYTGVLLNVFLIFTSISSGAVSAQEVTSEPTPEPSVESAAEAPVESTSETDQESSGPQVESKVIALEVTNLRPTFLTYNSFRARIDFTGDENQNGLCTLYYCNESLNPGCLPYKTGSKAPESTGGGATLTSDATSGSVLMKRHADYFEAEVRALGSPNRPSDNIRIHAVCTDQDGATGSRTKNVVELDRDPVLSAPIWKDKTLAKVHYGSRGLGWKKDQRSGEEADYYSINPDGIIDGDVFVKLAEPLDFRTYERRLLKMGQKLSAQEAEKNYKDYLKQRVEMTLAAMAFVRILDHEAMKRKMAPEVTDERVEYVMNYALRDHAIRKGYLPADRPDPNHTSNEQLFAWLLETLENEKEYNFTIDWNLKPWQDWYELDVLKGEGEVPWPVMTPKFSAEGFPKDYEKFREYMKEALGHNYHIVLRKTILQVLRRERMQFEDYKGNDVSTLDLKKYYDALKESFKVYDSIVSTWEIRVEGSDDLKRKFVEQFYGEFAKSEAEVKAELRRTPKEQWETVVSNARMTIAPKIFSRVSKAFQTHLDSKKLKVSFYPRYYEHKGSDVLPGPEEDSELAKTRSFSEMAFLQKQRVLFEEGALDFSMKRQIFPKYETVEEETGHYEIVFVQSLRRKDPYYLDAKHPKVDLVIRDKIADKKAAITLRELVYALFRENSIQIVHDTCEESGWACLTTDAQTLANSLFDEVLFPNDTLGMDGQKAIETTLILRLRSKVMALETEFLFDAVSYLANNRRVSVSKRRKYKARKKSTEWVKFRNLGLEY